jgi:DNA-directed RNA polymerase subunit F
MAKKILDEHPATPRELKDVLDKQEQEDLSQFQRRTLEYLRGFSKVKVGKEKEMYDELLEIGDITDEEAIQIVAIMPRTKDELKTVFFHRKTVIMSEFLDNVMDIVERYRQEKEEE